MVCAQITEDGIGGPSRRDSCRSSQGRHASFLRADGSGAGRHRARPQWRPYRLRDLYDTHVDAVYRYILYRVREPSDAEDLTSDVFTRAFANIHRYRWQGKSFLAWLYTIARNAVTDRRRRQRPTVDLENAFGLAEDGPTAHEHAVRGEEVDALRGAVKHLTTEQQEVLVLRFVENMSSRQVANMLGKNEGAIRALQFRALGRLRKLMTTEVA